MSQIPLTKEYADVVGQWGEKIESRSLLLDKFVCPKAWGTETKVPQASSWSLMRIAANGSALLNLAKRDFEYRARGNNVTPENAVKMRICSHLATTAVDAHLEELRPGHSARFLELLKAQYSDKRLRIVFGRLEGRLAINLAEGLIQNAGINLDRIFGLPLIPGSAVKGVTRSVALAALKQNPGPQSLENLARIFGLGKSEFDAPNNNQAGGELNPFAHFLQNCSLPRNDKGEVTKELKGAVTFLQAMPLTVAKIVVDITNVHTPDYYRTGLSANLKKENPLPNYFPAVERGAEFAFPLLLNSLGSDPSLLDMAEQWLILALQEKGIGAKTAAGYGWFSDLGAQKKAEEVAQAQQQKEGEMLRQLQPNPVEVERLSKLDEGNLRGLLNIFVGRPEYWNTPEETQRALLEVPMALELWKNNKENPKAKVTKAMTVLAEKFGVQLP